MRALGRQDTHKKETYLRARSLTKFIVYLNIFIFSEENLADFLIVMCVVDIRKLDLP